MNCTSHAHKHELASLILSRGIKLTNQLQLIFSSVLRASGLTCDLSNALHDILLICSNHHIRPATNHMPFSPLSMLTSCRSRVPAIAGTSTICIGCAWKPSIPLSSRGSFVQATIGMRAVDKLVVCHILLAQFSLGQILQLCETARVWNNYVQLYA